MEAVPRAAEAAVFRKRLQVDVPVAVEIIRSPRPFRRLLRPVAAVRAVERVRAPIRSTTRWAPTITARHRLHQRNQHRLRHPKRSPATTRLVRASKSKRFNGCLGNCERVTATIFDAEPSTADSTRKSRHTGHSPVCFLLRRSKSGYVRPSNAVSRKTAGEKWRAENRAASSDPLRSSFALHFPPAKLP